MAAEDQKLAQLRFDPDNARLPPTLIGAEQDDLLRYLARTKNLVAIGESMSRVGYFEEEPLLVVPNNREPGTLLVVEGNRRLAALRLLTDPTARRVVGNHHWDDLAQEARANGFTFESVPALMYQTRDELLDYLGFRHVSGIAPWSADAKARFISRLVLQHGSSFYEAGRAIGSRSDVVRRQFVAFQCLETARGLGIDTSRAEADFGVWYRALQNPAIRNYVGVQGWLEDLPPDQIRLPDDRIEALSEVLSWLFGEPARDDVDEMPPAIRDSRDIDLLGRVLRDSTALALLRETRDVREASELLGDDREIISGALTSALRSLIIAAGQADLFVGDREAIDLAERVEARLDTVLRILRKTSEEASGTSARS